MATDPRPERSTIGAYDSRAVQLARAYEGHVPARLHRRLTRAFRGRRELLELGCGTGRDAAFLRARGHLVTALDGSRAMLEEAARRRPELAGSLVHHTLPDPLPFPDGRFTGAYALASLMHLRVCELPAVFTEIRRVLAPRGRLLYSVCTHRGDVDGTGTDSLGRRFTLMDEREWARTTTAAGFREIRRRVDGDSARRPGFRWACLLFERLAGATHYPDHT